MPAGSGRYRSYGPPPPLPDPDTLPFPGPLIRTCKDCGLSAKCRAPVPGENLGADVDIMLVGQNPGCFPAGTWVLTPDGVRDIAKTAPGNKVLDRRGAEQSVTHVFKRQTDRIVALKVHKLPTILLTPNHLVRVITAKSCYDEHTRRYCFPCSRPRCARKQYDSYHLRWKRAETLTTSDFVVVPEIAACHLSNSASPHNCGIERIPFPQCRKFRNTKAKKAHWRSEGFRLGRGLAYVLGWYMAEGSADVRCGHVQFSLGASDARFQPILQQLCERLFKIKGSWVQRDKSRNMFLYSRPLAAWFLSLFGSNATVKRVPAPIFHSDPRIIKRFVSGWYLGDGRHKRSGKNDGIVTASSEAAFGLHALLSRLGIVATVHEETWRSRVKGVSSCNKGFCVEFPPSLTWKRTNQTSVPFGDSRRLLHIDSVNCATWHGDVFNIETEDNQFLVPFVVHNSNEDQQGCPFVGATGEYLDSLLFQARIPREDVAITNVVKCMTPGNRIPSPAELRACSKWIDLEVETVDPYIIVAMGRPAVAHFLGPNAGSMEQLNGQPVQIGERIILPMFHPAAALHDTAQLRYCSEAFQVLRALVSGSTWLSFRKRDEYPNPEYRLADTPGRRQRMRDEARDSGEFGLDTEQCHGKPWSYQVSAIPGTGWFVPMTRSSPDRVDFSGWPAMAIVHFYLHDIQYVKLRDDGFVDNMVLAYLIHAPQGLKELGRRLCGVPMKDYKEIVRPGQQTMSHDYLSRALEREWSDPPELEETKWDNRKGEIVTRIRKPWHISRKMINMLGDLNSDPSVSLWDRWHSIPVEERAVVESVLGAMPESSLADIDRDQAIEYACCDADVSLRVYHKLVQIIDKLGLNFVQYMDIGILPMVHDMMKNGMAIDVDHYRCLSEDYDLRMRVKAAELAAAVGHSFNPNSPPQVATVMYTELGFKPTRFTSTGLISTDDAELKKTGHPVAEGIIRYRGIQKLKSTYADNMVHSARPDLDGVPRIHTKINTTRTETGRLSSSKDEAGEGMNLQNIPTRSKEARAIKSGIIAPNGRLLTEGDLSQIEMRVQAHLANCRGLIELFNRGGDPHTETAARLFGVSLEKAAEDKYRYPTKRAGFGIIYLIGAHGLSTQINEYTADLKMDGESVDIEPWDEETCQKFIDDYYRLYPEITVYQRAQLAHARRYGYVQDMFGRVRYIPEVSCPIRSIQEAGARMAANMPIQASAQGVIKMAMVELWDGLPSTPWGDVKTLMQIHDSLLFECWDDEEYIKGFLAWVKLIMTGVVHLAVPLGVDFKTGHRWGEMSKVDL